MPPLMTVGHGTLDEPALSALLRGAGVEVLIDVRRFPGSRRSPHVARDALAQWLPRDGIDYRWEEDLGGRRRLPPDETTADSWWTVEAFRAYAAHTRTAGFEAAFERVLDLAASTRVAVMCSETTWWRCHRRLIADVAVVGRATPVLHLMPGGRLSPHRPAQGARAAGHRVFWDAAG
jgi:uncharacterized protein (DUF488 family)